VSADDLVHLTRDVAGVGTIEFVETPRKREYWLLPEDATRRQRMPSVTTILRKTWPKPELLKWYARHGAETETLLEQAAERGKAVHAFVEHYMTTGGLLALAEFPTDHHPYLQGMAKFLWEYDPQPLAVERLICHPELHYAGRLDLIAELAGKPVLLDFKTNPGGRVYSEAHVQAAAYRMADKRCGGEPIDDVLLVGISSEGAYHPVPGACDVAAKVWGCLLDSYGQMQRLERELGAA